MFRQLTIATAISAVLCPTFLYAQENTKAENIERVEVTGSRLKGVDLEGTIPLTVLDQDAIKRSGANTIHELLKDLSVFKGGSGTFPLQKAVARPPQHLRDNLRQAYVAWAHQPH